MPSIKLAFKNVGKSIREYVIYFLTLALGVCVFYVFNAMDSQALLTGLPLRREAFWKCSLYLWILHLSWFPQFLHF